MRITRKHYRCLLEIPEFIENDRRVSHQTGIRCLLCALGMNAVSFAHTIGASHRTVQNWRQGRRRIGYEMLMAIHKKYCRRNF